MPKVTVLITAHGDGKCITQSIQSVLDQTFQDFEIVITDDGSTERTVREVSKFRDPRVRLFSFHEDRGAAAAILDCIAEARGEYIAMLNSNNIFLPEKLEKQVRFLDDHPDVWAVFCYPLAVDEEGNWVSSCKIYDQKNRSRFEWLHYFFYKGNALCHSSVVARKEVYTTIAPPDPRFAHAGDFMRWIGTCLKHEIHVLPERLVKFRLRAGEENAGGNGPESQKRTLFELEKIYRFYLNIETPEGFLKIFPETGRYEGRVTKELIPYFLGRLAIDNPNGHPVPQRFGIDLLFDLLQDGAMAARLENECGFHYDDFIKLTGEHDLFGIAPRMELIEKEHTLEEMDKQIEERDARIEAIADTWSWRITKPLRMAWNFPAILSAISKGRKEGHIAPYRVRHRIASLENRPRILHLIANFMTGGSSRLVVDLIERLGDRYEQEVVTGYCPDPPHYVGLNLHEFRRVYSSGKFDEYLDRFKPGLVHIHYWGSEDAEWYRRIFKVIQKRGFRTIENINTPVRPYWSESIAQYVYVSQYVLKTFGRQESNSSVIYPGSDFDAFSRTRLDDVPDHCIGMVYRLEKDKLNEKSIDVFIKVVKRRPQTKVLIVGGGTYLGLYKESAASHGVMDAFEFTGYVPYENLPALYRKMSVFVAPVWKESFGQVTPFAMNMGIPVVGYNVGALAEIIGNNDLLAPPGHSDRLAEIIHELLDNRERRLAIGERNMSRASANFSVEAMVRKYEELYESLVRQGS